jgi:hypothetical protein
MTNNKIYVNEMTANPIPTIKPPLTFFLKDQGYYYFHFQVWE